MKAAGMAALGGLLGGIGKGIETDRQERRELALANLKRQWDIEDAATAADASLSLEDRKHKNSLELSDRNSSNRINEVEATGSENRKTKTVEAAEERETKKLEYTQQKDLRKLESTLRQQEDRASKLLADRLGDDDVQSVQTAQDGSLVVVKKNGGVETTGVKLHVKEDGEEGGGTIKAAQDRRSGGEKVEETSNEANRLRTLYANATPEKAPGLFRDGKKIPYAEYERLMKGQ